MGNMTGPIQETGTETSHSTDQTGEDAHFQHSTANTRYQHPNALFTLLLRNPTDK